MPNLSQLRTYFNTLAANVSASHILSGKIGFGSTGQLTGTLTNLDRAASHGLIFNYTFPTNLAGSYTPVLSDAQIVYAGMALALTSSPAITLTAAGYLTFGATSKGMQITNFPAKTTSVRMHIVIIDTGTSPASNDDCAYIFNRQDGSNQWLAIVKWDAGTAWKLQLHSRDAGTLSGVLASVTMTTAVGSPASLILTIWEQGDTINMTLSGYEVSTPTDDEAVSLSYTVGSRSYKTSQSIELASRAGITFNFRSITIIDI